jgi:tRNA (adenine57-N1/adenine58-N1)-methyltransferase
MYILSGKKGIGYLDVEKKTIKIGHDRIHVNSSYVIEAGDTINVRGNEFCALPFNPTFSADISERGPQVIQSHDAAAIIFYSGIKYGSKVIESGSGSGVLTSFILWTIGEKGSLQCIDINEKNLRLTRDNINMFGLGENVTYVKGDVRNYRDETKYDAIFLDIPDPWEAMESCSRLMKNGGSIITYSPNFNQTEKTVMAMEKHGIYHRMSFELLKRDLIVRDGSTRPDDIAIGHTGFISVGFRVVQNGLKIY